MFADRGERGHFIKKGANKSELLRDSGLFGSILSQPFCQEVEPRRRKFEFLLRGEIRGVAQK